MQNPLIIALDLSDPGAAVKLVHDLAPVAGAFKVGSELFTTAGPEVVREIRKVGTSVFLDLKFHDIPNTVARAVAAAVELDVQMLTVHIAGGREMLKAAAESARTTAQKRGRVPPAIFGVTVLTSLDSNELGEVGVEPNVGRQVERLANLAAKAPLQGIVCSPLEIADLRQILPKEMKLVTPGIRGPADKSDDQKRTMSAREALAAGANWLVVGRPITAAPNPKKAAEAILASLKKK